MYVKVINIYNQVFKDLPVKKNIYLLSNSLFIYWYTF